MTAQQPIKLFFSYAHEDGELKQKLAAHLAVLQRSGILGQWSDAEIKPGQAWEEQILRELDAAQVILLLVSSDFFASEYCNRVEVRRALERERLGQARVVPVLLRSCDWGIAEFSRLQALPTGAKPIATWDDLDDALADVARGIRVIAEELRQQAVAMADPPKAASEGGQEALRTHPIFRNAPLEILGEDYDPFRAFQQVLTGALKGAYPSPPIRGPVVYHGATHSRILHLVRYAAPRIGLPYDLIAIPYRALGFCVEQGLLAELDPALTRDHADQFIWWREMGMIDDRLYGVPLAALTMLLAVRADVFSAFGLDLPNSWRDYSRLIDQYTAYTEQIPGSHPQAPALLQGRCHVTLWYEWLNYLYAYGTTDLVLYGDHRLPAREAALSLKRGTRRFLRNAAKLAKFASGTGVLPHFATANWDDGITQFSQGNLLMHLMFNDALESLEKKMAVQDPVPQVQFLPIPSAIDAPERRGQVEGWVFCVPKQTRYYRAIIDLLDWFLTTPIQRHYHNWGGASAHRLVIAEDAVQNERGQAFRESIEDSQRGTATIDLVKCKAPQALDVVDLIVAQLYEAVLAVGRGVDPEVATDELVRRTAWHLRFIHV